MQGSTAGTKKISPHGLPSLWGLVQTEALVELPNEPNRHYKDSSTAYCSG